MMGVMYAVSWKSFLEVNTVRHVRELQSILNYSWKLGVCKLSQRKQNVTWRYFKISWKFSLPVQVLYYPAVHVHNTAVFWSPRSTEVCSPYSVRLLLPLFVLCYTTVYSMYLSKIHCMILVTAHWYDVLIPPCEAPTLKVQNIAQSLDIPDWS